MSNDSTAYSPAWNPSEPVSQAQTERSVTAAFLATMSAVLVLRIAILGVGIVSLHHAPAGAAPQFNLEHPWIAWDASNYYQIAEHGYSPDRQNHPGETPFPYVAYFPLVPLLGRWLSSIVPLHVALVAVSNVCSVIGFILLYDWARRLTSARTAAICVLILATFPGAVSFAAGMTEGPFLLLIALSLWLLQRDRFYGAALAAGIATAVRPTGVALAVIIPLYAWMRMRDRPPVRRLVPFVLLGAISFSGITCYEAFLWHRYHTPTAYAQAQTNWDRKDAARIHVQETQGVKRYSWQFFRDRLNSPQAWNRGIALLIFIVIVAGLISPRGIPRVLFLLPLIILLMTSLPGRGLRISSLPRYEVASLPLFLLPAIWLSPRRRIGLLSAVLLLQFAVQVYYAYLFPREIWVG